MASSLFAHLVHTPEDHNVTVAFNEDPSPNKLNLSADDYQTEEGKPPVLDVVKRAERQLLDDESRNKEYIPIVGLADFNDLSAKLIFGVDSAAIQENRVTTFQCLSGTGALRVGAEFLAKHLCQKAIYLPEPIWDHHSKVFSLAGLTVYPYRYYAPATRGLDFPGLLEDLQSAPSGSVVLLYACGHNPTGVDPNLRQWDHIRTLIRIKSLLPFFDNAYQGLARVNSDQHTVRLFGDDGGDLLVAQTYAKNVGLYGEQVGALSIVSKSADVASRVESRLKLVIWPMYSSPPIHGASILAAILKDGDLCNEWTTELGAMADRIKNTRFQLFHALRAKDSPGDWSHIINQIGMFTIIGLSSEQVSLMAEEHHIYMTSDGRINLSCLSSETVTRLADAIHAAVTQIA